MTTSEYSLWRWSSSFLMEHGITLVDFDDFADGVKFCQFIESITHSSLKFHTHPKTLFHKIENFDTAIRKMEREGVPVHASAVQLMNNKNLLIGFIWTICSRYRILLCSSNTVTQV
jgi:hypothetical protein